MATYKTRAISLRAKPFAESDKLVTLFTREHGKVRIVAKSARKVPSRFGGRVETFTYGDFFIAKGRNLDILSQCQVMESFQSVRQSETMLPSGLYLIKLVEAGTAEGQPYPELFDLLLHSLCRLKDGEKGRLVAAEFTKAFVVMEGIHCEGVDPHYALSDHVGRDLMTW